MIVVFSAVWAYVRRLQHRENLASRNQTAISMPIAEAIAKPALPASFTNLPLNQRPMVNLCWGVRAILIRLSFIRFVGTQYRVVRPRMWQARWSNGGPEEFACSFPVGVNTQFPRPLSSRF